MIEILCECDSENCLKTLVISVEESREAFAKEMYIVAKDCEFLNRAGIAEERDNYYLVREEVYQ